MNNEQSKHRYNPVVAKASWIVLAIAIVSEAVGSILFSYQFRIWPLFIWAAAIFAASEWFKLTDRVADIEGKLDAILEQLKGR
jgi:hypothetical protein